MELGERIEAWCKATGKTYQDLADACGITVAAVYQWIGSGETTTKPKLGHLETIVELFGVSMERFFGKVPPAKKVKAS